jgi:NAD(P)-dependent dehydrogenase (short-subunit alcohol dehydrogenase family)
MGEYDGKVVIVTGGAMGIGAAIAEAFVREGAAVTVADVDRQAGRQLVERFASYGHSAHFVAADLASAADCESVVSETASAFGGLDILCNNVGIQPPDSYLRVEDTPEGMWDRIIDVNLKSYFLMSKSAIPEIRKRGGGVVINTASVQGLQSMPGVPAYAASKGGVLSLTQQMSIDYARENIRVLAVCPGAIDTPMLRNALESSSEDVEAAVRNAGDTHPIGRIGTGRDIANAVLFLASERASFMTGDRVCVDGGYMALGAWASATPVSY